MPAQPRSWFRLLLGLSLAFAVANGCGEEPTEPTEDPTISLSIDPASASVEQGGSVEVTGTATVGGSFTGGVTVTVEGVPSGVTGTVGTPQTSGNTTTIPVTIMVGASVAPGTYPITVRAAGSGVSDEATFTLTVTAAPQYTLEVTPTALSIEQGMSGTANITLGRTNFTGTVNLTAENAPSGMTVSFDPAAVTGDASAVTVMVDGSVAEASYDLTIRGEATGLDDRTATLTVTVTVPPGPAYSLSVTPDQLTLDQAQPTLVVVQGASGEALASTDTAKVDIMRVNGHTDAVALDLVRADLSPPPSGVTATFDPATVTGDTSALIVSVGASVATGEYQMVVRGDDGVLPERTTPLLLIVNPAPAYELVPDPSALSIEQGTSGSTTTAINRTNFSDNVTLSLEGAPAGVTSAFDPNPAAADASTLTLEVDGSVATGDYPLTIRGQATGLADRTASLTLTVTEAVGFSLGSVADITIQQGASDTRTVEIIRTGGFAGEVTVEVTPTVAGLTMAVDPASTTGNSVTLTATADATLATGTYPFEVKGSATGEPDAVTSVDVNVTPMSGNEVVLDFSGCVSFDVPVWLAYQDGVPSGTWTQVTPVGSVFTFTFTQSTVGVALATADLSDTEVVVAYFTESEITGGPYDLTDCFEDSPRTATFNITGLDPGAEFVQLSMGGSTSTFGNGSDFLEFVEPGAQDVVGAIGDPFSGTLDRVFLRRDVTDNALGTLDMSPTGSEVVAATSATITVGGGTASFAGVYYNTSTAANACQEAPLQQLFPTGATFTASGVPPGSVQAGDFHNVELFAGDPSGSLQTVQEYFATLADRTVTLPTALPAPTITDLAPTGPYKQLEAVVAMPGEYDVFSGLVYSANNRTMAIFGSTGFLGTGSQTLAAPDLSGVSGWVNAWVPAAADQVEWIVSGSGGLFTAPCTEGGRVVISSEGGTQG